MPVLLGYVLKIWLRGETANCDDNSLLSTWFRMLTLCRVPKSCMTFTDELMMSRGFSGIMAVSSVQQYLS